MHSIQDKNVWTLKAFLVKLVVKLLNIFDKIGCSISPDHIESCNRISKKGDTVIVKFSQQKDCQQVWQVKKDLQKMKKKDFDLPGSHKLFINRSLCPYYRVLWSKNNMLSE